MKYDLSDVSASLGNNPHYFFLHDATAPSGPGRPYYRGFTIILRHTTLSRDPLDGWSARRRGLYLHNTQHSQQTDIHATGGIRTRKRAAADPRLRRRGPQGRAVHTIIAASLHRTDISSINWRGCLVSNPAILLVNYSPHYRLLLSWQWAGNDITRLAQHSSLCRRQTALVLSERDVL